MFQADRVALLAIAVSVAAVFLGAAALSELPLGLVPDWIEAFGSAGALIMAVRVLQVEQRNRMADQREAQARKIGGHIWWPASNNLRLTVTNASDLPVRAVQGLVFNCADPAAEPLKLRLIAVAEPGETDVGIEVADFRGRLELIFDDDASVVWRKYGNPPLVELTREEAESIRGI